jgi:hypothetical protein
MRRGPTVRWLHPWSQSLSVSVPFKNNPSRLISAAGVKKDFSGQLHKFMASLTETANQSRGHTVLYLPEEDVSDIDRSVKDKDLVQRLEAILIHWTRQIKEVCI